VIKRKNQKKSELKDFHIIKTDVETEKQIQELQFKGNENDDLLKKRADTLKKIK